MYQLRPPCTELQPFIEHYWFVTADDGPVDLRVNVFVDARADLILNFGAPYLREVIGGATAEHTRSNLDAQRLVPIRIVQQGLVRIAGVRFRLGGLGPFTRVELRRFTGCTPEPADIFGDGARALEAQLASEPQVDAQAALLDAFLLPRLATGDGHTRFTLACNTLAAADGNLSVETIAAAAGVSSRQVDRLFARYLGITPKTLARVLRFQRTLRRLMQDPGCPLSELAADAGYFDQSHFVRDFKRMSGGVPRGYRGYFPPAGPRDFAPNVVVYLQDVYLQEQEAGSTQTRAAETTSRSENTKPWQSTGRVKGRRTIPGN